MVTSHNPDLFSASIFALQISVIRLFSINFANVFYLQQTIYNFLSAV